MSSKGSTNNGKANLGNLFSGAVDSGTISPQTSAMITGHLGQMVIAGAAGLDSENITASDVTLITVLIDRSSSIGYRKLQQAVRDGHAMLVDSLKSSREKDSILMALWTFNHDQRVVHSYLPVDQATRLNSKNYRSTGATSLYDVYCDALAANVAYAQTLRDSGTPCRSVVVVITDGEDTSSTRRASDCARISADLLASEQFVLAFVGVGDEVDFRKVARSMGIPAGCIEVEKNATPQTLRGVFQMVSRSALRASQGLIRPGAQAGFFS